ncbi:MAG TPA: D-alanyl-D-alanine carboxypeptidase/D-alanyl-D-alanine-endopeptidase [Solirubrobacteraceae bacterium]|nr:D-alanyl-D-alanine carboxypeptidase/D-alanyl-D-alanine-endopeptidase [Solirubrobacteraceae bacterium]
MWRSFALAAALLALAGPAAAADAGGSNPPGAAPGNPGPPAPPTPPPTPPSGTGRAALKAALGKAMRGASRASGAYVTDLADGTTLFAAHGDVRRNPASVEKIYTTSTALRRFGPATQFATTALSPATIDANGVLQGDLYLRGGGDPTFGSQSFNNARYGSGAAVEQLARLLAQAGLRRVNGNILGDESLFDDHRGGARTGARIDPDIGAPLSALNFNRGKDDGSTTPAATAADRLAAALRAAGVRVDGGSDVATTPAGSRELAHVSSPPLSTLVRLTNRPSDNFLAETLLKDLGAAFGGGGSTSAGAEVVRSELHDAGISARVVDGSGLSRSDHTSPHEVVRRLAQISQDPVAKEFTASLPTAGQNGTLAKRMRGTAADGRCHAKTGTLSDVSALAGYCDARSGETLAFAFLMNRTSVAAAHTVQDRMATALARFGG